MSLAGNTYVLGRTVAHVVFATASVQDEYATADQHLHPQMSKLLVTEDAEMFVLLRKSCRHMFSQMPETSPAVRAAQTVSETIVFGYLFSFSAPLAAPLAARCRAGWLAHTRVCRHRLRFTFRRWIRSFYHVCVGGLTRSISPAGNATISGHCSAPCWSVGSFCPRGSYV